MEPRNVKFSKVILLQIYTNCIKFTFINFFYGTILKNQRILKKCSEKGKGLRLEKHYTCHREYGFHTIIIIIIIPC